MATKGPPTKPAKGQGPSAPRLASEKKEAAGAAVTLGCATLTHTTLASPDTPPHAAAGDATTSAVDSRRRRKDADSGRELGKLVLQAAATVPERENVPTVQPGCRQRSGTRAWLGTGACSLSRTAPACRNRAPLKLSDTTLHGATKQHNNPQRPLSSIRCAKHSEAPAYMTDQSSTMHMG